ncbi:MAG: aminotransferase class I/II-fold pyridoxal phosphate-dependent enzyme [Verrucomicrobia bacterium]|nr:aminotransferase class I/II-fold pyridoxal phosphate-dependent enzyme [Verrucomicrobiota bacterium]MBS0637068.1 aminotransferase class I/II-fold pyridoxal phosphate-dependent enzyme [Verrucomicrobiota bacterium]
MFSTLTLLPADPIYGMQVLYKADPRQEKINLSIGICLDEQGKLLSFKAIREAEKRVFEKCYSKEYLPISGYVPFIEKAEKLLCKGHKGLFSAQTVGGTGALYIARELLVKSHIQKVFIPDPTWPNHRQLFGAAGLDIATYTFDKLLEAIPNMPRGSAVVLQASCHNPTGVDPTKAEWQKISLAIKQQGLLPIIDLAYLGLGGGIDEDTQAIDIFLHDEHELFLCTTFAKSMGIYNDRLGLITIKATPERLDVLASHVRSIARCCYSSPAAHGAFIAHELLGDEELKNMWLQELATVRTRLQSQRELLYNGLKKYGCKIPYEHILTAKGLFCLLQMSQDQVIQLREKTGVYIALDGRIAIAALTPANVDTIAKGLCSV